MGNLSDYRDPREAFDDYRQEICPECGVERWFKHLERERWQTDQWNCQTCGSFLQYPLEYPCPECDTRMEYDDGAFVCRVEACDHDSTPVDAQTLINRLSDDSYMVDGYNSKFLECPACGESSILSGPDGELQCDECGDFYAGRFMDPWYCYAIWMWDPDTIRVTV